jgi:hypothetical protein
MARFILVRPKTSLFQITSAWSEVVLVLVLELVLPSLLRWCPPLKFRMIQPVSLS